MPLTSDPSYRNAMFTETVNRLAQLEKCSPLSIDQWCKGLLAIAASDAMIRTALERGVFTNSIPDPKEAATTIETT